MKVSDEEVKKNGRLIASIFVDAVKAVLFPKNHNRHMKKKCKITVDRNGKHCAGLFLFLSSENVDFTVHIAPEALPWFTLLLAMSEGIPSDIFRIAHSKLKLKRFIESGISQHLLLDRDEHDGADLLVIYLKPDNRKDAQDYNEGDKRYLDKDFSERLIDLFFGSSEKEHVQPSVARHAYVSLLNHVSLDMGFFRRRVSETIGLHVHMDPTDAAKVMRV